MVSDCIYPINMIHKPEATVQIQRCLALGPQYHHHHHHQQQLQPTNNQQQLLLLLLLLLEEELPSARLPSAWSLPRWSRRIWRLLIRSISPTSNGLGNSESGAILLAHRGAFLSLLTKRCGWSTSEGKRQSLYYRCVGVFLEVLVCSCECFHFTDRQ